MNRKLTGILTLVLALILITCTAAFAEVVKTPAADGSLNVRSGPGTNYSVNTWVKNGQSITVLENTSPWAKIRVDSNGKEGYIRASYIVASGAPGTPGTVPPTGGANYSLGAVATKYASSVVNVRKGPGTTYSVAIKVASGARLNIFGESGNWYLVRTQNGTSGYISKNYVSDGLRQTTTANVNFREGAGTGYASKQVLPKGTRLTATDVSGNWTKVNVNGASGYVYSQYLK